MWKKKEHMKITEQSIKDDLFADLIRFQAGQLTIYELMDKILTCQKLEEWFYQQKMSKGVHDVGAYYEDNPEVCTKCLHLTSVHTTDNGCGHCSEGGSLYMMCLERNGS